MYVIYFKRTNNSAEPRNHPLCPSPHAERNLASRPSLRAIFALSVQGSYAAKVLHSSGGGGAIRGALGLGGRSGGGLVYRPARAGLAGVVGVNAYISKK